MYFHIAFSAARFLAGSILVLQKCSCRVEVNFGNCIYFCRKLAGFSRKKDLYDEYINMGEF